MRRIIATTLILTFLSIALCSCGSGKKNDPVYTVVKNGTVFTVDARSGTVTDDTYSYLYTLEPYSSGYRLEITYPDGAVWWWVSSGQSGYGGWSEEYDETRYAPGDVLREVLTEGRQGMGAEKSRNGLVIALLVGLGLFNALAPRTSWYLSWGWRYKDAEPSELALTVNRVAGVVAVIIGVFMLFL